MDLQLVVFDLSGTTIRDSGQVTDAFIHSLRQHGIEMSPELLASFRGASKREVLRRLVADQNPGASLLLAEGIYLDFRKRLQHGYEKTGVDLISGAGETFAFLRKQGVRIALNTGFDREITDLVLRSCTLNADFVVCSDDVPRGRPEPDMIFRAMELAGVNSVHFVANVGDTVLDLQAGKNAGVNWNIGVYSGAHTKLQLETAPHTHLLPSIASIPSLFTVCDERTC